MTKKNIMILIGAGVLVFLITLSVFIPLIINKIQKNAKLETPEFEIIQMENKLLVQITENPRAQQYYVVINYPTKEDETEEEENSDKEADEIGSEVIISGTANFFNISHLLMEPGVYSISCYTRGATDRSTSDRAEAQEITINQRLENPVIRQNGNYLIWDFINGACSYNLVYTTLSVISQTVELVEGVHYNVIGHEVRLDLDAFEFSYGTNLYIKAISNVPFVPDSGLSNRVIFGLF